MDERRWRPAALMVLGTLWLWMMTLPQLRLIASNPDAHPPNQWVWLVLACVALLTVDVAAAWYAFSKPAERDETADRD